MPIAGIVLCFSLALPGLGRAQESKPPSIQAPALSAIPPEPLPREEQAAWRQAPEEKASSLRSVICLNGWWKFVPVAEPKDIPWGYLRVPGSWAQPEAWSWDPAIPSDVIKGDGGFWKNWDAGRGKGFDRAFYEKPIHIPESWKGKSIVLDLARVSTDAQVYVDGVKAGQVAWPAGQVDLTSLVTAGKDAVLTIFVLAAPEAAEVFDSGQTGVMAKKKPPLYSRGLIGDVTLVSRPAGAHIDDLFIKTSWREHRIAVEAGLADVREDGEVLVTATMLDESGKPERTFTTTVTVKKAANQTVEVAWPWESPRLWDLDAPNLYTCLFSVKGTGIRDECAQEFGFREFWIEGRYFKLNGTPIRLRPYLARPCNTDAEADALLSAVRSQGYNLLYEWADNTDVRSYWGSGFESLARRADHKGMLLSGIALDMGNYVWTWNKPGVKERYRSRMAEDLRRHRNHPAYIMWATSANLFAHSMEFDPRNFGRTNYVANDVQWKERADHGKEGIALIKEIDPTRPVFGHGGTYVGDISAPDLYLNLMPLQEREDYLSAWAANGELPFFPCEFEMPCSLTFHRARDGYPAAEYSEPWLTEFCAGTLGREAYALEEDSYRKGIAETMMKPEERDPRHPDYLWNFRQPVIAEQAAFQKLVAMNVKNVWRSWRTWGISGGMLPWCNGQDFKEEPAAHEKIPMPPFRPGTRGMYLSEDERGLLEPMRSPSSAILPIGRAFQDNDSDLLAWIAGPRASFTSKDHSFACGSPISKQAVLLNDSREAKPFKIAVRAYVAGEECFSFHKEGRVQAGETLFVPFDFVAPPKSKEAKAEGAIELSAEIGEQKLEDTFRFRVFKPSGVPSLRRSVVMLDSEGDTRRMLRGLGVPSTDYTADSLAQGASAPLLVIGRKALGREEPLPEKLEEFVKGGGRVLVMAQDPEVVRANWGFRVCGVRTRQVFTMRSGHPALGNLDREDLRDWAGESTLVQSYPTHDQMKTGKVYWNYGIPFYGYYWGTKGVVTTAAFEKPHFGGWTPILECEFDLQYSPLMELGCGMGKIILCALDLEDHWEKDPAAKELARSLVAYAANATFPQKAKNVVYVGDENGEELLKQLGARYRKSPHGEPDADITILGPGGDLAVKPRGRIFCLPNSRKDMLGVTQDFHGSINVPDWPEAAGISPSDLRWRADASANILKPANGFEVAADGLLARSADGKVFVCQVDPGLLDVAAKPYFRFTRWRQTRTLSQLLANIGVTFDADRYVFSSEVGKEASAYESEKKSSTVSLAGMWKAKLTKALPEASPAQPWADAGLSEEARAAVKDGFDDSTWEDHSVGRRDGENIKWYGGNWAHADGEVVFRKTFEIPAAWAGKNIMVSLGNIQDDDHTFIDGAEIGSTNGADKRRCYEIPAGKLLPGVHAIAVRVWVKSYDGGLQSPANDIYIGVKMKSPAAKGFYHPDYWDDFEYGDDPYRYLSW